MNEIARHAADYVVPVGALVQLRASLADRRVALGTGCFDIVHVGHVYFLEEARQQAEVLVVGVNSDRSVRALKGDSRPIVPDLERAIVIAALHCVDHVFIYDDVVADDYIRLLCPDVYVTGAESVAGYPSELSAAGEVGARVHVVGRRPPHSTTSVLTTARDRMGNEQGRRP